MLFSPSLFPPSSMFSDKHKTCFFRWIFAFFPFVVSIFTFGSTSLSLPQFHETLSPPGKNGFFHFPVLIFPIRSFVCRALLYVDFDICWFFSLLFASYQFNFDRERNVMVAMDVGSGRECEVSAKEILWLSFLSNFYWVTQLMKFFN